MLTRVETGQRYAFRSRGLSQGMGRLDHYWCRRRGEGDLHSPVSHSFHQPQPDYSQPRACRFQLVTGRTWRGTAFGGVKGRTELPGLVQGQPTSSQAPPCGPHILLA